MRSAKLIVVFVITQIILMGVFVWLFEIALARTASTSDSTTPHLISYQGVLTDDSGNPINGTRSITTTIYDAESGGTALWHESFNNLTVTNGIFSALLGSGSAIPDELFDRPDRWLEIQVEDVTLTPRQRFTSVPYALNADKLDGLDSSDIMTTPEIWKFACGENFFVDTETGLPVPSGCSIYSYFDNPANTIYAFPPAPITKTIETMNLLVTTRTGSYAYPLTFSIEVRDFFGNVKQTASSSNVDFQSTPLGTWTSVPLSSNPDDLIVSPGEYLAVLISRGGAPGGDLFMTFILEATVK